MGMEQYFLVADTRLPESVDPFEAVDGGVVCRVVDVGELEGDFRLSLDGARSAIQIPKATASLVGDRLFLRALSVYKIIFHLKMTKVFPENWKVKLKLVEEVQNTAVVLSSGVTEDGSLVMYIHPFFRMNISKFFPLALMTFEENEVQKDDVSRENRSDLPSTKAAGAKSRKGSSVTRSEQVSQS